MSESPRTPTLANNEMIAKFRETEDEVNWRIVNDGVMGGRSVSRLEVRDGFARFSGHLSGQNNGGFASVRTTLPAPMSAEVDGIAVGVRGDGRRYQLRLRTDKGGDGIAYKHDFQTREGQWQQLILPLVDFRPTYRGRPVAGAPALSADRIEQLGFLVADKQFGEFCLDFNSIRAVQLQQRPRGRGNP